MDASPLLWPGVLGSLVLALLLARPVGRLLAAHRVAGFLLVLALGGIATLTLLPDIRRPLWENARYAADGCVTGLAGPRPLAELLTATQSSLNVALFVPLGAAVVLAGTWPRRIAGTAAALALPVGVEALQYALPVLGRACDEQDVWDNLFGLAIGAAIGLIGAPPVRRAVRALRARRAAARPTRPTGSVAECRAAAGVGLKAYAQRPPTEAAHTPRPAGPDGGR
ncbi:VanZ family protein [Kitasatospora sp. DSM 101779]|uniref:VanZ family protein n=1 Tax=Kitasatospora sp. DSM 101779 TaxID=2853165 RepID=UPI0021DA1DF9|nr:VanZ family protein [Kitasatospora sp. DSM 101779]MCU7820960.1 VanZ family protein [Kitasatospora sp. DSM 101779]